MSTIIWEAAVDRFDPDQWRVEGIGPDGECYVTVFDGPDAEQRAKGYIALLDVAETAERLRVMPKVGVHQTTNRFKDRHYDPGALPALADALDRLADNRQAIPQDYPHD